MKINKTLLKRILAVSAAVIFSILVIVFSVFRFLDNKISTVAFADTLVSFESIQTVETDLNSNSYDTEIFQDSFISTYAEKRYQWDMTTPYFVLSPTAYTSANGAFIRINTSNVPDYKKTTIEFAVNVKENIDPTSITYYLCKNSASPFGRMEYDTTNSTFHGTFLDNVKLTSIALSLYTSGDVFTFGGTFYIYAGDYVPGYGQGLAVGLQQGYQQGQTDGAQIAQYGIFSKSTLDFKLYDGAGKTVASENNYSPLFVAGGISFTDISETYRTTTTDGFVPMFTRAEITINLSNPFYYSEKYPIILHFNSYPQSRYIFTDINNNIYNVYAGSSTNYELEFQDEIPNVPIKSIYFEANDQGRAYYVLNYMSLVYSGDSYYGGYTAGYNEGYDIGYDDGKILGNSVGYHDGYNSGIIYGYESGYADGEEAHANDYSNGYNSGYNIGYSNGYNLGNSEKFPNPVTLFLEPVHVFLNTNLFGNFSIGMAFNVVLFVAVACIFIKMFAGG